MYAGQRIEILGGDNVKIFDIKNERWVKPKVDYAESKKIKIYGITLPIMKKEYLIKYKKILGRGVDKQDINEIE